MLEFLDLINKILFIFATALVLLALVKSFVLKAPRCDSEEVGHWRAIFLVILLAALAVRLWQFGAVPGGVNQDGAMAAVDGKALADYGIDRFGTRLPAHLYAWGYGQMSSLLSYLIAVFVKFGGLNVVTMRLPQLIASMASLVFFSLLMRELFGDKAGLAAAAFAAINPWHFVQSRWALDCNLLPHFFVAAMFLLVHALKSDAGQRLFLVLSMLCFGLCMYCYGISLYTVPPILVLTAAWCLLTHRLRWRDILVCTGIYLLVSWPFILTMAVNFFKLDTIELPFVTIQYFPNSIRSGSILFFSDNPLTQLWANLRSLLNVTLLQKSDLAWNEVPGFGTLYLCSAPFVIAGFFQYAREKAENKFLVFVMLLAGVFAGLLTNGVNINRVNIIYYALLAFAVLGLKFVSRELRFSSLGCGAAYALLAVMFFSTYFGSYAESIRGSFFYGFGDALTCAEDSGAQTLLITSDTQSVGSQHVSEILTLFYDETDALYFQGKTDVIDGETYPPYKDRFVYMSFSEDSAETAINKNAACVITADDAQYFDERFEVIPFGNYCAVLLR